MDALSDVLRVVRLSGGLFLDAEFTAPWCITPQVGPEDCRPLVDLPARVIAFHYVLEGRLLTWIGKEAPTELSGGMVVLLPRNDPHTLASARGLRPVRGSRLIQTDHSGGIARIRHGGGGVRTRIVCGFLATESRCDPLLDSLPQVLVLDLNGRLSCEWMAHSFRYAAEELKAARVGSSIVTARLAELMFVEAVRSYLEAMPRDRRGWLAGLRDPAVGRALALLHTRIAHPWTTEELAREVFLSRSAFAERFTALIGVPPIRYLTRWRMEVAARRLRETHRSVGEIAADVGYESDLAFARAFRREFSMSPAEWRKQPA